MRADPELPEVFSRAEARTAGLTDRQVDRRLLTGRFRPVRRGLLTAGLPERDLAGTPVPLPGLPLRPRVVAALRAAPSGAVVSHDTAAVVWGLPTPMGDPRPVSLTRMPDGAASTRYYPDLRIEVATLQDDDLQADGPLTAPARTVVDCCRHLPGHDALAIADAAVHLGLTGPEDLAEVLRRCSGWPGVRRAARVLPLVDGRRESPLESWSAWAFHTQGTPLPVPQVELVDDDGVLVARADFWWVEGVVGEADGRAKYLLRAAALGGATDEALAMTLHLEREREGHIRHLGAELERWDARDVLGRSRPAALGRRLERARTVAASRGALIHTRLTPAPRRLHSPQPPSWRP